MSRMHGCTADAVVIGGGFYGCAIAVYLAKTRGLRKVILLEREPALLRRASYHNQARVHNGYHYPRNFPTAFRSQVNFPRFLRDWSQAIRQDFLKIYAIAGGHSKVTARQFERFCLEIGAQLRPAAPGLKKLFNPHLIEEVFLVEECVFDAVRIADCMERELRDSGVDVFCSAHALALHHCADEGCLRLAVESASGAIDAVSCRYVFNCSYSGINQLSGAFGGTQTALKQEVTEMALMQVPAELRGLGITVMDGPFFSLMPFPARDLHTLSHVRYTPHFDWQDRPGLDPYKILDGYDRVSRADRMIRDAARYLPLAIHAKYVESMFEVKTVLLKNEGDDGRPILFEKHPSLPGCYSILGGKIDNIYDVLAKLEGEVIHV